MIYTTSTFLELAQKSSLCIGISGCVVVCHLNILVRVTHTTPCSRLCSLEEQYFKCGIFGGYDAAQRLASNSEAPVLAG